MCRSPATPALRLQSTPSARLGSGAEQAGGRWLLTPQTALAQGAGRLVGSELAHEIDVELRRLARDLKCVAVGDGMLRQYDPLLGLRAAEGLSLKDGLTGEGGCGNGH